MIISFLQLIKKTTKRVVMLDLILTNKVVGNVKPKGEALAAMNMK